MGIVAGNWKMHGDAASITTLLDGIAARSAEVADTDLMVFPPAVYLPLVIERLSGTGVRVGAQTVSAEASGAHTGDLAASMLADMGCTHVIVGHSERRHNWGESNEQVAAQCAQVIAQGMTPIVCVGETEAQHVAGETLTVCKEQLDAVLKISDNRAGLSGLIIAYEPVWAIGTGRHATPEQAQTVHAHLRACLSEVGETSAAGVQILYGGSVKPDNAVGLFAMPDVNGALVGGASLNADAFIEIGKLCKN